MKKKNPTEMSIGELENFASYLLMKGGLTLVQDTFEAFELEDKLSRINLKTKAEYYDKVRWKSTRTEFIKMYTKQLKQLREDKVINHTLLGILTELALYVNFEDNYLKDEKGRPYDQKQLAELLGIAETTAKKYFKELIEKKLILKEKNPDNKRKNVYYLCPKLFYQGVFMDKELKGKLDEFYAVK